MPNAAEGGATVRPWLLSLGSLALLLGGLLLGISLLPEPWPRIVSALLCLGLTMLVGFLAIGSFMDTPFGFATWGERRFLAWTARFAPDPGLFLYRWAEAAPTLDRARERLFLAAEQGYVPALRDLGRDYLEGAMGTAARGAALPWLQRAADRGDAEAAYWLGEAFRWGMATPERPEAAHRCYLKAAHGGYRPAAIWLARAYATGDGLAADAAQATAWTQRAEALPGPETPAPSLLNRMVERPSRAEALAGELAEAGGQLEDILWPQRWFRTVVWTCTILFLVMAALFVLATPLLSILLLFLVWLFAASLLMRFYGFGIQRTSRDTRKLEIRAQAGEPEACHEMGLRFDRGHHDLPKDQGAAREWYSRAARSGHPEALIRLADLLSWGLGGPKDSAEARRLLERAAALGVPAAHAQLGRLEAGLSGKASLADEKARDGAP